MYTVATPVIGRLIGQRTHWLTWVGAVVSIGGLYALVVVPGTNMSIGNGKPHLSFLWSGKATSSAAVTPVVFSAGELLVLVCAVGFAVMLLTTDYYLEMGLTPVPLTLGEFVVAMFATFPLALYMEGWEGFGKLLEEDAIYPVAATGILEIIGYILGTLGQDRTPASHAAVVMALESPFAVCIGIWTLDESLSIREGVGCVLMFTACILNQLGPAVDGGIDWLRGTTQLPQEDDEDCEITRVLTSNCG
jgi:drug/metabolite transporter (DMT)-like permease